MASVISIIGSSGSGKSTSMRDVIGTEHCIVFRLSPKPFPFRKKLTPWDAKTKTGDYVMIPDYDYAIQALSIMGNTYGKKIIIIEDSTFFMTQHFMATAKEVGFEKFTNNALGYYNIIKAAEALPEDCNVYLVNHIEEDASGLKKVKTIGKMLDDKVDIPSLLTIALEARFVGKKYIFETNKTAEKDLSKSPMDMFKSQRIPNDLAMVDNSIREYYYQDKLFPDKDGDES